MAVFYAESQNYIHFCLSGQNFKIEVLTKMYRTVLWLFIFLLNSTNNAKRTLSHSKRKNTQKKLFMDERYFHGFPPVFGKHRIPFQAPAEKVYTSSALVVLFYNVNFLMKVLILLFTQFSAVLVWLQKVQFDWHWYPELAETLQKFFNFLLVFRTPVVSQEVCIYWLQWMLSGQSNFALCFVKHCKTLGPSWVLLFEGHQIYQLSISPCLSVGTSPGGKQTHYLPCPLPSRSFSLLLTSYLMVEAVFYLVQRESETERYASHVLTLVLTATLVWHNVGRHPSCSRDTESKETLCTYLGAQRPI